MHFAGRRPTGRHVGTLGKVAKSGVAIAAGPESIAVSIDGKSPRD